MIAKTIGFGFELARGEEAALSVVFELGFDGEGEGLDCAEAPGW